MLNLFNKKIKNTSSVLFFSGENRETKNLTLNVPIISERLKSLNLPLADKAKDPNNIVEKIAFTLANKAIDVNNIAESRHYPPANKEWFNSIYAYNKNYLKSLPMINKIVNKLIKGYFNLSPLKNKKKSRRVQIRFRRLSLNRILVSRAEIKHTNNKVIITVYLYNRQKKIVIYKLKNLYTSFIRKMLDPTFSKKNSNKLSSLNTYRFISKNSSSVFSNNKKNNPARKTKTSRFVSARRNNYVSKTPTYRRNNYVSKTKTCRFVSARRNNYVRNNYVSETPTYRFVFIGKSARKPTTSRFLNAKKQNENTFLTRRFKTSNQFWTRTVKKNYNKAFSNLKEKNLLRFLISLRNTNIKGKNLVVIKKYFFMKNISLFKKSFLEIINKYVLFLNKNSNTNYYWYFISWPKTNLNKVQNRENNVSKVFKRKKNYSSFFSKKVIKKFRVTKRKYSQVRKSRKIKIFLYKLKNLHRLLLISNNNSNLPTKKENKPLYSTTPYKTNLINVKKIQNYFIKNLYKIFKKKKSSLIRKFNLVTLKSLRIFTKVIKDKKLFLKTLKWNKNVYKNYIFTYYKNFLKKSYKKEILYLYYIKMLSLNGYKFKNWFLIGLKSLLSKIYNKKVEFNYVNIKYLHLNSDIFSESIAVKLRNRKNRLLRVLKKALNLVKLKYLEKNSFYDKTFINKYKTLYIDSFIYNLSRGKDVLHQVLCVIFPEESKYRLYFTKKNNIEKKVLKTIKHTNICGVRFEATGRLTRRLTASRSIFKFKYKGSLKNLYSSYKKLTSVMLRGHVKSNIQYTKINSKTRNGSFGLKGWVSSY